MDNCLKENMKAITGIENKYGSVLFRMGLTHLVDVGHRNLSDEDVVECEKLIIAQGEVDKASGKITVMTPEFQCEIVRCAAELARFSPWTLVTYIKKCLVIR